MLGQFGHGLKERALGGAVDSAPVAPMLNDDCIRRANREAVFIVGRLFDATSPNRDVAAYGDGFEEQTRASNARVTGVEVKREGDGLIESTQRFSGRWRDVVLTFEREVKAHV